MNEFLKLQNELRILNISFSVDDGKAAVPDAVEILTAWKNKRYSVEVFWKPRGGFGISAFRRGDLPSGFDGPDEMYKSAREASSRIAQLLETESSTDSEKALTVAELRLVRNMTQKSLAEALGVDVSVVTKRELAAASSMRLDTLANLAAALGGQLEVAVKFDGARRFLRLQ
jgi:DNA-binding Xre family transcriptional regulator